MSEEINDRFARLDDRVAKIVDAVSRIDDRVTRLENREAVTSPHRNQTVYIDQASEPIGDSYRAPPDQYAQESSVISKWQNRPRPGDQPSSNTGDMERGINVDGSERRTHLQQPHTQDAEQIHNPRPAARKQDYKKLPRAPTYDGVSDWDAYYARFSIYARKAEWSKNEQLEWLGLLLEGKAGMYYTRQMPRDGYQSFETLIQQLKKRFGKKDLPQTLRVEFSQLRQSTEENLDD